MPPRAKHRGPFGQRLVEIRKARGLSQYDLADMTGISHRMIAHYETIVRHPTPDTVVRLAKVLKISTDELMGYKPVKVKEEVDRKVFKRAKMLGELPPPDRKAVMRMIDSIHSRNNGGRAAS